MKKIRLGAIRADTHGKPDPFRGKLRVIIQTGRMEGKRKC